MSRVSIKTRNDLPSELKPLWDKMTTYGPFENQAGVMAQRLPILLGGGARLFENVGEAKLQQIESVAAPGVTHIRYGRV